ncbi:MAG: Uncharacterised protein [Flavobacteriales bacterium]|jgi:hypothetical protein|nr:MAG: hypothetical protein DBW73_03105 [Flavobacteriales bacterium]CAI8249583.1 MAG: Uncharacterised protein [Flavobacteriales bacterium]|tara:strand:- start:5922 stop:6140 length:219 start_codon:yes stop_codon:yes gene_type:complete
MRVKSKALILNLIVFGVLFVIFRAGIGTLIPLPYLPLLLGSAVLASFCSPKFLAKGEELWVKLPWKKTPIKC